jgi:integration host factor subunit beta
MKWAVEAEETTCGPGSTLVATRNVREWLPGALERLGVKTLLDAMTDALISGQRIEIRGFGSFATNSRPPRIGRNPKSGETVVVPGKRVPHFKAGKELRERVDAMVGQPIHDD